MKRTAWSLLLSERLAGLSLHEQYFAYSDAYLDSAERLCRVLARSTRKATFERGAVVLYLAQHALELFYKGAILRKFPGERHSHGVDQLRRRYASIYKGKRFEIREAFCASCHGLTPEEVQLQGLEPPVDQLYRYPEDKKGKPWKGLFAFEASSFSHELAALREGIANARQHIDG